MQIHNCDQEKLQEQKQYLKNEIINGVNSNYFKVIDLECGTGKSLTAEESLLEMAINTDKKALFVLERTDDCDRTASKLNKLAGKLIAIAVHSKNTTSREFDKTISKTLSKYPIIIITHQEYKELSINDKKRELFCGCYEEKVDVDGKKKKEYKQNRNILIIDEFLNMAKNNELMINNEFINNFETLLGNRTLRELFVEIVAELEDYLLLPREKNTFFNANTDPKVIDKKANKLKALIRTNLTKEYCISINNTKNELCKKVDNIKAFYQQTCIVEGNLIYCTNLDYKYWFLENNIMLDGSGNLNKAYELAPNLFRVQSQAKVLDHGKWKFNVIKTNSTASGKKKALNYYEIVNQLIISEGVDKTLYVGNIEDEKSVQATYVNHMGNITGSNQYKDLQNVVIGHNPNVPFRMYILEYIYFSNSRYTNVNSWDGIKSGYRDTMTYRFKEKQFEEYRQCRNANEIYQAIKRINRNMFLKSKVTILNNDLEMVNKILNMFKNNKSNYLNSEVEYEKNKMDAYNEDRKENSYARKFIKVCKNIVKLELVDLQQQKKNRKSELVVVDGIYSKKKIYEYMNLSQISFANYVLNDLEIIDYFKRHNIIIGGQIIDFANAVGF